ncbi:MAG: tetratricopeptide repeat protein [Acidobacteriota bacterium]|nr:tetratricopeptide repeat protein [Acidobacteriota bacterium]
MRPRPGLLAAFLTLLLSLTACGSLGPQHLASAAAREAIAARGLDPDEVLVPFQLTEEMEQWAREAVPKNLPKAERSQRLLEALVQLEGLNLQYRSDFTGTAEEVFETRQANCLSFTHLFVAMARSLHLDAYFLFVQDIQSFFQEGDLVINASHVTAATGPQQDPQILEFTDRTDVEYRRFHHISDLRAVALFYSNRGAELLRKGQPGGALQWLETAVQLDPALADGWVNLGVVRRRLGDLEGAETAYQRALQEDAGTSAAYHNLAALYRHLGKEEMVEELLTLADESGNRNPFTYLRLGDINLRQGELDAAQRFYRRASQLDPELAEAYAALGQWALEVGREKAARRWLRQARRLDPEDRRVVSLGRQLETP